MSSQNQKISGIILAAGRSVRMNRTKQLLPYRGDTILGHVIKNALASSLFEVIAVLGHAAENIQQIVDFGSARVVINEDYMSGLSTSIKTALSVMSTTSDAALFILGDQPRVGPDVIDALIKCYGQKTAPIIIPTYQGTRGNPVLIDRNVFPRLSFLEGDVGARILFDEYADQLHEIELVSRRIAFDLDTPDDYAWLNETEKDFLE